jgi:choline dehydrogenase-like flavoprotein
MTEMVKMVKRWATPIGPDVTRRDGVDVCVIGSGAGGAPAALALARAGYRVVVLEKGPAYDQRDFVNDEVGIARRDFFRPSPADDPHIQIQADGRAHRSVVGWTAVCVGGGTVHMSGFSYRLHPEDLKLRSVLGEDSATTLIDWPIAFEELEPYYEKAEIELGVSGVAGKNPFERQRRPFPLPPLPESGMARLVEQACEKLGYHAYPTPRAVVSRPYQGRPPCQPNSFCGSFGCPVGAKSSTLAALLPKAVATGRCQIRPMCMVHTIDVDRRGHARRVGYFDSEGRGRSISARVVVVACSPVETARLLLHSGSKAHRAGLCNENGWVGSSFMLAGFGGATADFSFSDPRLAKIDWNEPWIHRSVQDFYFIDRGKSSQRKGGTLDYMFPHPGPIYLAERMAKFGRKKALWGQELKDRLRETVRDGRQVEFEVTTDPRPLRSSRVTLDPRVKDRWGLPVARMDIKQHRQDVETNKYIVDRGVEILEAMGGKNARVLRYGSFIEYVLAGTCRFGKSAEQAALDRDCRSWSCPNLFVCDGSFMPTMGGTPNTLTIVANSFRVGDRIAALGRSFGLERAT